MPNYGYRLTVSGGEMDPGTRQTMRVEFEAPDRRAANTALSGWAMVNGYTMVSRELLADGMTFREAGERRAMNIAAQLSLRYGAAVEGPHDVEGSSVVVRVILPDGRGLSLLTGGLTLYDPPPAVEALAFGADGKFIGESVRNVDVHEAAELLERRFGLGNEQVSM
jgi:hypothetical protein